MHEQKSREERVRLEISWLAHRIASVIEDRLSGLAPAYGCTISRRMLRNHLFAFLERSKSGLDSVYRTRNRASHESNIREDVLLRFAIIRAFSILRQAANEFISTLKEPIKTLVRLQNLEKRQLGFSKRICLARQGILFTDSQKLFNKTNRRSTIARPRPPSTPRAKKEEEINKDDILRARAMFLNCLSRHCCNRWLQDL